MTYKSPKELELIEKLEGIVSSLNYELRDLDLRLGRPSLIRLTIDVPSRERGINLDDCYEVHKVIDPLFDVWDPLESAYTLEVSSPGEKAPLRLKKHFEEAKGENIEFKTREAIPLKDHPTAAPRKNWRGKLLEVDDEKIKIEDGMGIHEVSFELMESARWLREWTPNDKGESV
jgi:ribosome maturation factor RimP